MSKYTIFIPTKLRITLATVIGTTLLVVGALALALATIYSTNTPAFIGLGLIFWGTIFLYIRNEEYTKNAILTVTANSLEMTLDCTLRQLGLKGKPVYLPPRYLNSSESNKAFIPRSKAGTLPTPEQTRKLENRPLASTRRGILVTPPGAELARLFENTLGKSFTETDLNYLRQSLPKLLIEDLEIAQNVDFQIETPTDEAVHVFQQSDTIRTRIATSTYAPISQQTQQLRTLDSLGCPLTSAIALAIARATGKPTIIQEQKINKGEKTIETTYKTLPQQEQTP